MQNVKYTIEKIKTRISKNQNRHRKTKYDFRLSRIIVDIDKYYNHFFEKRYT